MNEVHILWMQIRKLIEKKQFIIEPRQKNRNFKFKYGATDNDILDALLDLKSTDFLPSVFEEVDFTKRSGKILIAQNYYHKCWKDLPLYIKIKQMDFNKSILVLSFHKDGE